MVCNVKDDIANFIIGYLCVIIYARIKNHIAIKLGMTLVIAYRFYTLL